MVSGCSARKAWVPRGGAPRSKTPPPPGSLPKCVHPLVMPAAPLWLEVARVLHYRPLEEPPQVPLNPPKHCMRQIYQAKSAQAAVKAARPRRTSTGTSGGLTARRSSAGSGHFAGGSCGTGMTTPRALSARLGGASAVDQDDLSFYAPSSCSGVSAVEPEAWALPRSPTPAGGTPRSPTLAGSAALSRSGTPLGYAVCSARAPLPRATTPSLGPSRGATPISWVSGGGSSPPNMRPWNGDSDMSGRWAVPSRAC